MNSSHWWTSTTSDVQRACRIVRHKVTPLIEQWQRICILAERIIKRREAAAVWNPSGLRRHFVLPLFSSSSPSGPFPGAIRPAAPEFSSSSSIFSASSLGRSFTTDITADGHDQADLSRLSNVLKVVEEVNERCWRGDDCELCEGVRHGVGEIAGHVQTHADLLEQRVSMSLDPRNLLLTLWPNHRPAHFSIILLKH